MNIVVKYFYNIGVGLSQTLHAVFGGDPDESVSGATGKAALQDKWWFKNVQMPFINFLFQDPMHCYMSIEDDEGDKGVYSWYDRDNPVWRYEEDVD